jgi:ABC-type multidrug transport system ATPase subunit
VLLLDEPTKSLDPAGGRSIRRALAEWANGAEPKRTLVVATNDPEDVSSMCSVYFVIANRRVTYGGPVVAGTAEGVRRPAASAALDGAALRQDHA